MDNRGRERLLSDLWNAERWDYLEEQAHELLSLNPENLQAHYYLARASICLKKHSRAKSHIDFILSRRPESPWYHHAAALYHRAADQRRRSLVHLRKAISYNPEEPHFFSLKAIIHWEQNEIFGAKRDIERAHQLDPTDPDIARRWIEYSQPEKPDVEEALQRVAALRQTLSLDPENAATRYAIGRVLLDELYDAHSAEPEFRECVRLKPDSRQHTESLFSAVAHQSLVFRTLKLPSIMFFKVIDWISNLSEGLGFILLIVTFKIWIAILLWFAAMWLLLEPLKRVYEWLLVSEILATTRVGTSKFRALAFFHRFPFGLRLCFFTAGLIGFWSLVFLVFGIELKKGFQFMGVFCGINFGLVLLWHLFRKVKLWAALRKQRASGLLPSIDPLRESPAE